MILVDTHVLVWWTVNSPRLSAGHARAIHVAESQGVAVSVISFLEVAQLASKGRVDLAGESVDDWVDRTSSIRTLHMIPLAPRLLLDSTRLPNSFHGDPADRIIVATARALGIPLLTEDRKILAYRDVVTVGPT